MMIGLGNTIETLQHSTTYKKKSVLRHVRIPYRGYRKVQRMEK